MSEFIVFESGKLCPKREKSQSSNIIASSYKSIYQTFLYPLVALSLLASSAVSYSQPNSSANSGTPSESINGELISANFPFQSRYVEVLNSNMHYVDEGDGEVVLFIHGNPTSSYLWRNVIPHVSKSYRTIAIDLIGMGKSDKPDIEYTYLDHRRYLNAFIDALDLKNITFVIHDWGSVLGTDYAMNNEANVRGVAFMEALLPPRFPIAVEPNTESIFGQFRDEDLGEKLILDENYFVEQLLPSAVIRELSEEEMNVYREPYLNRAARYPTLMWPRELPMGGNPAATTAIITDIGEWMKTTDIPMLFLYSQGQSSIADYYVENLHNIETHYVGVARHYLQEDHPESISRAVHDWKRRISDNE